MQSKVKAKFFRAAALVTGCAAVAVFCVAALQVSKNRATAGPAVTDTWMTSLPRALAQAEEQHKLVMIDFGGSDWCPACQLLEKNVLSSKEFSDFAATHLVLVSVDFPQNKPQPEQLKKANEQLSDRFHIDALPALVFLNSKGNELFRFEGYDGSSAKKFVASLELAVAHVKKD